MHHKPPHISQPACRGFVKPEGTLGGVQPIRFFFKPAAPSWAVFERGPLTVGTSAGQQACAKKGGQMAFGGFAPQFWPTTATQDPPPPVFDVVSSPAAGRKPQDLPHGGGGVQQHPFFLQSVGCPVACLTNARKSVPWSFPQSTSAGRFASSRTTSPGTAATPTWLAPLLKCYATPVVANRHSGISSNAYPRPWPSNLLNCVENPGSNDLVVHQYLHKLSNTA